MPATGAVRSVVADGVCVTGLLEDLGAICCATRVSIFGMFWADDRDV